MRTPTLVLAVACVCSGGLLPAQLPKYISSPKGLLTKEGNASFSFGVNRRFQGIDNTHNGSVLVIKSFALRRNGTSGTTNTAGTADATLDMGLANFGLLSVEMDKNYMAGTRKSVFKKAKVNFPNWGSGTTTPPAPFDFTLAFNTTFIYLGRNALLWDLTMQNNPSGGNVDRDYVFYQSRSAGGLGTGCVATGQTSAFNQTMTLQSNGAAMPNFGLRMLVGASNGPRSTGLMLSVALSDSNFTVPGWCAKVHAVPLVLAPLGTTDAAGLLRNRYFSGPYAANATGVKIVSQLFAVDAGQVGSIALSNGRSGTIPSPPTGGHEAAYLWCPTSRSPHYGTVFCGGSIIARFGY